MEIPEVFWRQNVGSVNASQAQAGIITWRAPHHLRYAFECLNPRLDEIEGLAQPGSSDLSSNMAKPRKYPSFDKCMGSIHSPIRLPGTAASNILIIS
jgi:hypothetical protein